MRKGLLNSQLLLDKEGSPKRDKSKREADFTLVRSLTRFGGIRHSPMPAEGGSSGKSTPNWSRMEEVGGSERGSTGKFEQFHYLEHCKFISGVFI